MDKWKSTARKKLASRKSQGEDKRWRRSEKGINEDAGAQKGRKDAKHCVFPMFCGSAVSTSRLAEATGAEPAGQMKDKRLHAVVARSTCPSQNVQSTPFSDHFWKLRCRKSACRCGAKHISQSKVSKAEGFGELFDDCVTLRCRKSARRCGAKSASQSKV